MVQPMADKFAMPYHSWETILKIIRAYNAASSYEKATVNDVAKLAGFQRPVVSANNNFLREMGLLQADQNKLTPLGTQLATGIEIGNQSMVTEALQESVKYSPGLTRLLNTLRARGTMSIDAFKGQLITVAQLTKDSPTLSTQKTVIDYLEAAEMIENDGTNITYLGHGLGAKLPDERITDEAPPAQLSQPSLPATLPLQDLGIPLPLGVGRLAYLKLPERWDKKDLAKLLKMIELALGDENE
jgi:hypothetical protein